MKREMAEFIVDVAKNNDIEGISLYENYSGRGMYGKSTSGVNFSTKNELYQTIAFAAAELQKKDNDELIDFIRCLGTVSHDAMGKDFIVY